MMTFKDEYPEFGGDEVMEMRIKTDPYCNKLFMMWRENRHINKRVIKEECEE